MVRAAGFVVATLIAATLTGCGTAKSASSAPTTATPATPVVGMCRDLTPAQARATSDGTAPVPCSSVHTAETVAVSPLAAASSNSASQSETEQQLSTTCQQAVTRYVGGTAGTFELSVFQATWFVPTASQISHGAAWYRCDVVAVIGPNQLAPLPDSVRGALAAPNALQQWGLCGTTAPSEPGFQRVLCTAKHAWRAVAIQQIPSTTAYLDKGATATASNGCKAVAQKAAKGALTFTWSFQWPNQQQWQAGQRFGWCWLPTAS